MSVNRISLKMTRVTIAALGSTQVLARNDNRTYLAVQNVDVNAGTLAFDRAATANDFILNGALAAGQRGDVLVWESSGIPGHAINLFSTTGTTFVIIEGVG